MTASAGDPQERVELSMLLRPRHSLDELEARLSQEPMSREDYAEVYGADPSDIDRVTEFARAHNLEVLEASPSRRTVRLAGRAADVAEAFDVSFHREDGYRVLSREPHLPDALRDVVQGVFGLDERPVAHRLT